MKDYARGWTVLSKRDVRKAFKASRRTISSLQNKLKLTAPTDPLLEIVTIGGDSIRFSDNYLEVLQRELGRTFGKGEGNHYTGLGHYASLLEKRVLAQSSPKCTERKNSEIIEPYLAVNSIPLF